jgi:hypothetical protein
MHAQAGSDFILAHCESCARQVLTHTVWSENGGDELRCVHCDRPTVGPLCFASSDELPEHGYDLVELGGCGNPNCGGGRCSRA